MKIHLTRNLFVLMMISQAAYASGGAGSGNGGGGIVCRDPSTHQVLSVSLYDLWEGSEIYGQNIRPMDGTPSEFIKVALGRLTTIHELFGQEVTQAQNEVINKIQEDLQNGAGNVYLSDTNDSMRRLMPKTCPGYPQIRPEYEQIINYTDEGQLLVDHELYPLLSPRDQVAIQLHEAIYKVLRDFQDEYDSVRTRKIVALLFTDMDQKSLEAQLKTLLQKHLDPKVIASQLQDALTHYAFQDDLSHFIETLQTQFQIYGTVIAPKVDYETLFVTSLLNSASSGSVAQFILDRTGSAFDPNKQVTTPSLLWKTYPLFSVIESSNVPLLKYLLTAYPGLDLDLRDLFNRTPLECALRWSSGDNFGMVELLLNDPRVELTATFLGKKHILNYLLIEYYGNTRPEKDLMPIFDLILNHPRMQTPEALRGALEGDGSLFITVQSYSEAVAITLVEKVIAHPGFSPNLVNLEFPERIARQQNMKSLANLYAKIRSGK